MTFAHPGQHERDDLRRAVLYHCTCGVGPDGIVVACASHAMLIEDSSSVGRLLFARSIAQRIAPRRRKGEHAHD
jgi:hypothetical protein